MKEERVRKKYVEKQPPDKPEGKPKTKYVAKSTTETPIPEHKNERKPHHKPKK